jgi:hypothetical protein
MIKSLQKLLILAVLAGASFYVYANYFTACTESLAYSVGSVDPRFGITQEAFAQLAQSTESVWESPFQKEFFRYDPNAEFKINLVFDDRQQRTIDEKNTRTEITTKEQQYRADLAEYQEALAAHKAANDKYEADAAAYEARLNKYNEDVDYWNKQGGAPAKDYTRLQQEKAALQRESRRLDAERDRLNLSVVNLNVMVSNINAQAKVLNFNVDEYNGKFGTTREFDQGSYTGSAINIYQFSTQEDLGLVLAHEFGHALGLDHVHEDPSAIMYYLMDKQNLTSLQLTRADMDAVRSSCNL